ncbi:tRNA (guanosine(46)-N7)-methyltransferase TrmB [Idiomarina xiamenensis]|uniref:tRNA (guanine-N(7)-)-methyltransferase n=1 Tax=Idiomarina xiamenensis 10-D-4 TaxID=740709 RepID=K2L1P5_9GAMM|nr:tRNA (guanosine(46)-N7)-methyltransferase TrmB [Idiomarina xiamenensis]EKE83730.1 methyltransferase [Idiomarina xiamenensis 10-D-4]
MSEFKSAAEAAAAGKYVRTVRSFVKREGRLTKGQQAALSRQWPHKGLQLADGLLAWSDVFANDHPVVLEIGFGMGDSLVKMAQAEQQHNFVGIEVHTPGVGACLLLAEQAGVENLRVFDDDAVEVLKQCVADHSLSRVQIFFPDPWHKKRHHKRRIIQPEFIALLAQKLKVGGVLHLATDWQNYAEHMLAVMSASSDFSNLSSSGDYIPRPENRPLTKFEQRGHRLGHGVWDLQFTRVSQ